LQAAFEYEFDRLDTKTDVNALNIAINILVGDHVFDPEQDNRTTSLEGFEGFFQCAEEIEATRRRNNETKVSSH
jgi:hypothetical protein